MCARFELNKTRFQPGNAIAFWRRLGFAQQLIWAGFARKEWLRNPPPQNEREGLVDIPASRFAERSRRTAQLVWEEVPAGKVIRGLVKSVNGQAQLKIVTRECTEAEAEHFGHDRICVIEAPLFSSEVIPIEAPAPPKQGELF